MNYNKHKRIKLHKEIAKTVDNNFHQRKKLIRILTTIEMRKK